MFTQNIKEVVRTFAPIGKGLVIMHATAYIVHVLMACILGFFRWLYEKTRLPLIPMYGGFPVKLRYWCIIAVRSKLLLL